MITAVFWVLQIKFKAEFLLRALMMSLRKKMGHTVVSATLFAKFRTLMVSYLVGPSAVAQSVACLFRSAHSCGTIFPLPLIQEGQVVSYW